MECASPATTTEAYDGTTWWSESADVNTGSAQMFGSSGPQTGNQQLLQWWQQEVLVNQVTNRIVWDGTSWTEVADIANGQKSSYGGAGVETASALFRGFNLLMLLQKNGQLTAIKTFTAS